MEVDSFGPGDLILTPALPWEKCKMLYLNNTALIIIDVQGKLANLMHQKETLFKNFTQLVKGSILLKIPILITEQNPRGLGPTIPEIMNLLPGIEPVPKMSFSCCAEKVFMERLKEIDRNQLLITGIESHICVYQTGMDLVDMDYEVQVVSDAISSRVPENKSIALQRMSDAGVRPTSVEMALFELVKTAEYTDFRKLSSIIK
jgi:nicotinamidase-related amidase